jgi:hypothetical protein
MPDTISVIFVHQTIKDGISSMTNVSKKLGQLRFRRVLGVRVELQMHMCFIIDFMNSKVSKERISCLSISSKLSEKKRL